MSQASGRTVLFVVGDRFDPFADQTSTRTVCQFTAELRAGAHRDTGSLVLFEGQGLGAFDWERIHDELDRTGLTDRTDIHRADYGPLAGYRETHKHRECNVLIAGLTQVDDTRFRAALRLHNDAELLLDHQASHVQGMVVLEAARQMFLAVSERYYASRWPHHHYAYSMENIRSSFHTFLFPLPATLEYEVRSADLSNPEMLGFDVQVGFEQAGLPAAVVHMACTGFLSSAMRHKERRGAERAVRYLLNNRVPATA